MHKQSKTKKRNANQQQRIVTLLPISAKTRKLGRSLLDQQMWCWGQDVRRPEGNLLLAYGFTRYHCFEAKRSSYLLAPTPDCQIALWGFGMFYGDAPMGGLFLKRYEFQPKLTASAHLPSSCIAQAEAPPAHKPRTPDEAARTRNLAAAALRWISHYEQWIALNVGVNYRQHCIDKWRQSKQSVPAEAVATTWQELADYWQS